MRVGFIGIGTMGASMALNLIDAGHELCVHDVTREAAAPHVAMWHRINSLVAILRGLGGYPTRQVLPLCGRVRSCGSGAARSLRAGPAQSRSVSHVPAGFPPGAGSPSLR